MESIPPNNILPELSSPFFGFDNKTYLWILIGIMLISMGACVGIFLAIAIFDMITAQKYMKEKANNEQI